MEDIIKDFDKIVRPVRKAKLSGEIIDLSKLPTLVTIRIAKAQRDKKKLSEDPNSFEKTIETIAIACKSNPKVTKDWLIENTDLEQLLDFMAFVLEPVTNRVKGDTKNVPGDEKK